MKYLFAFLAAFALGGAPALAQPSSMEACQQLTGTGPLGWRMESLAAAKRAVAADVPSVTAAYDALLKSADKAMQRGPYSVTSKTQAPPSGDVHDYSSLAPYWWPDPKKKDGLPYIRRDGEVNPERNGSRYDKVRAVQMMNDVRTLTLAAYFSGDAAYAAHAADLLDTWFVAPETRMNPHLRFAQRVPGRSEGRSFGIIDTVGFAEIVDSARLLSAMKALDEEVETGLRDWFGAYADWLTTSDMGLTERAARNNHGTHYDAQLLSFALYSGNCALARRILDDTRLRIDRQIVPGGIMPEEAQRTRSLHYHLYNLDAFLRAARLAEWLGEDLYSYAGEDGASMISTLSLVAGYAGREGEWPYPQSEPIPADYLWEILRTAYGVFEDPALERAIKRASGRDAAADILLLTFDPAL